MGTSKSCKSDDRSALLKHRNYFRTMFIGISEAGGNLGPQTALESDQPGHLGRIPGPLAGGSGAVPLQTLGPHFPKSNLEVGAPQTAQVDISRR